MFKYKIEVTGSEENIVKFAKDLVSLGYEAGSDDHRKMKGSGTFGTNRLTTSNTELFMYSNKTDSFGNIISSHRPIEYNFDIDKEYDVALAVASQRSDKVPHVGEWVKILGTGFAKNNEHNFPKDTLFRVKSADGGFCHVDKNTKDPIKGCSIGYDGQLTKATAEEITEHFMKDKRNQLPEKWAISAREAAGKKDLEQWYFENVKNKATKRFLQYTGYYHFPHYEESLTGAYIYNQELQKGYTEITYKQWKNAQNMATDKKITGYKLLKDLPNVKAGATFTWDAEDNVWVHIYREEGEFVYQYSEEEIKDTNWFEPIYESKIKIEEIAVRYGADENELDTDEFTIAVSSDKKITVTDVSGEEGSEIKYEELSKVLDTLQNLKGSKWGISVWYIDIGCKDNVNVTDLIKVKEAYERLNSVK